MHQSFLGVFSVLVWHQVNSSWSRCATFCLLLPLRQFCDCASNLFELSSSAHVQVQHWVRLSPWECPSIDVAGSNHLLIGWHLLALLAKAVSCTTSSLGTAGRAAPTEGFCVGLLGLGVSPWRQMYMSMALVNASSDAFSKGSGTLDEVAAGSVCALCPVKPWPCMRWPAYYALSFSIGEVAFQFSTFHGSSVELTMFCTGRASLPVMVMSRFVSGAA